MINRFLIDLTEQRSSKMDKRYNRALGLPIFRNLLYLDSSVSIYRNEGLGRSTDHGHWNIHHQFDDCRNRILRNT